MDRNDLLLWSPRILGVAVSLFLSLFASGAFEPGKPLARALPEFAVNLLPAAIAITTVAVSWRRPWIGGVAFVLFAVAYALSVGMRLDWIVVISGPLLAVGVLFLWSWRRHQQLDVR